MTKKENSQLNMINFVCLIYPGKIDNEEELNCLLDVLSANKYLIHSVDGPGTNAHYQIFRKVED